MFARIMDWVRRLFRRECHYINGPETLPPPLTREEEETVMNELRAGDNTHRELLVVRNLRLVVYIAKKFDSCQTATEDLVSIGTIGLMKAVRTFDPNKNIKLATYASRCIENEILMHLRKVSNMKTEMSFDEPLSVDWDGNELTLSDVLGTEPDAVSELLEDDDEKRLLRGIVRRLPEKERQLMVQRSVCLAPGYIRKSSWRIKWAFLSLIFLGWKSAFYQRSARKCCGNVPNLS